MAAEVAARCVSRSWREDERAALAAVRATGPSIIRRTSYWAAPKETSRRASTRSIPRSSRCSRNSASRSHEREALAGVAVDAVLDSVSGGDDVSRRSSASSGSCSCRFGEAVQGAPRARCAAHLGIGGAGDGQLLCGPELGGVLGRQLRLHPEGREAARWSCRPTSGSTRRTRASSSAPSSSPRRAAHVSYLEGCTAPMRKENQLHAAVVELVAQADATKIKYSTVQNWFPGRQGGQGRRVQLRDQAGAAARAPGRGSSAGRRSRPDRPSPGSTRAASSKG